MHAGVSRPLHGAADGECAGTAPACRALVPAGADAGWVGRENARKGSTAWRIKAAAVASDTQLAGYADRVSIRPGEPLHLYVHHDRTLLHRPGLPARLVRRRPRPAGVDLPGAAGNRAARPQHRRPPHRHHQLAPVGDPGHAGWPEGTYLLRLTDNSGLGKYIPVTVRSSAVRGRLVLMNAVTTYQAYNAWGGYSLYGGPDNSFGTRAHAVSFDRPYDDNGARIITNYEQSLIAEAERANLPLAYLTDVDLERGAHVLDGARGLVSLGHDEYWTTAMRQRVTAARDHGVNLAFMGANAVYWRIRLQRSALGADRVVVGYKSAALDPVKRSAEHDRDVAPEPAGEAGEQPRGDAVRVLPRARRARGPRPGFVPVPRHGCPQGHDVRRAGRDRDRPRLSRGRHPAQPAGAGALAGRLRARQAHLVRRDVLLHALGVRGSSPSGRCCGTRASRGRTPSSASPSGRWRSPAP